MSKAITKIEIKSFRGATELFELSLDPSKDMTMIFGENGTGKSTILDAIDMVANEKIGALEEISCEGNKKIYLTSVGLPRTSLQATLHSNSKSWTATLSGSSVIVCGPSDERPRAQILRRSRILELVTAQPKKRYEVLQHFVDVGNVEKSEDALVKKINVVAERIRQIGQKKIWIEGQLKALWESNGSRGDSALEWARGQTAADISDLVVQSGQLTQLCAAIDKLVERRTTLREAAAAMKEARAKVTQAKQAIDDSPSVDPAIAVKLVDALAKTQEYISAASELHECPTCLRPIQQEKLAAIVTEQLGQMKDLKDVRDKLENANKVLDTARLNKNQATQRLLEAIKALHDAFKDNGNPEIAALELTWPDWENSNELLTEDFLGKVEALETVGERLRIQSEDVKKKVGQYDVIKKPLDDIQEVDTECEQLQRIKDGLDNVLDVVHSKRIAFIQGILSDIAEETNRLYQAIHPDENIELSALKMDEDKRGSVYQVGTFHGHENVPPQALFSESHLDTLGFCVWLALGKRQKPEKTIIVIDDVFSSADAQHLSRIVDLLATESKHFCQVIIATHFRNWLKQYTNARGPGRQIELILLGPWSIDTGIQSSTASLAVDELDELLKVSFIDRQAIASKTGVLLESILDQLTMQYRCSVSRAENNEYTLQPLLDGSNKLFNKPLTVTKNIAWNEVDADEPRWVGFPAKDAFSDLYNSVYVRNVVGGHENPTGHDVSDYDVVCFGDLAVKLARILICPKCGGIAKKLSPDGTAFICPCKTIKMTPVRA